MADASAVALAELLLCDDAPQPRELLGTALASDPPLVLWTVCVAAQADDLQPGCLDDVAQWLAEHALDVLQWDSATGAPAEAEGAWPSESWADRVQNAVQVADLAARWAAQEEPSIAESTSLLGLLHDAHGWLATQDNPPAEDNPGCLPEWLLRADGTPAARLVGLAVEVLAGEAALPDSTRIDPATSRERGCEARRSWLRSVRGIGDWVPALAARLARLAALENRFQETLETEKLEAMAEFAAGAGHEINNPLTVISGRAQLFLREEHDPERRRALALISAQAKRAHEMIADMMLFARPPKPEPSPIDIVELVDEVLQQVSARAARQETTLRREGSPGPVEIEADPTQLIVALRALCQNSLEAIGRQGRIEIAVYQDSRHVQIRISDDGPGISPEERRHLFDPYYSARQAGRGLGLGLSKCWRIVTNHGGQIEVGSRPGQGTVFTITLPQRQS